MRPLGFGWSATRPLPRSPPLGGQTIGKETPQMSKWNLVAMGQAGLTGWTQQVAQPVAHSISRRTGRPEAQILALIGAAFLAITVIDFLRNVDAVIAAGRLIPQPATDAPAADS
jgi:hypothetical protein